MKLMSLEMQNFKGFEHCQIQFDGNSAVFFGENGAGKSTILSAINYLMWNLVYRLNQQQGTAFKTVSADLVNIQAETLEISAQIEMDEHRYELYKMYRKPVPGRLASAITGKKEIDDLISDYMRLFGDEDRGIPVIVNYGTNRSVLKTPLRIRKNHDGFSKWTALERTLENELDYRTFFEWFRDREDYESERIRDIQDLSFRDSALECVRAAIHAMMPEFEGLQVKRNPLRLVTMKNGQEYNVDQLSDGEKCTLSLMGDLARRLALANPGSSNPLEGQGIVLIDEIELHMHPSWQRKILTVLRQTFPNIQFIITTHSPQVLGEVNDQFRLFMVNSDEENHMTVETMDRMDGYDSNYILEEFMETTASNPDFLALLQKGYEALAREDLDKAGQQLRQAARIAGAEYPEVMRLDGALKRGKLRHAKHQER